MSNLWVRLRRVSGSRSRRGWLTIWAARGGAGPARGRRLGGDRWRPRRLVLAVARFGLGVDRLALLRAVAVDGQRLEAELPAFEVGLADVLDRGLAGHVARLGDRAREERLGGGHHPHVGPPVDARARLAAARRHSRRPAGARPSGRAPPRSCRARRCSRGSPRIAGSS